jgi:hypothetical protein
MSCGDVDRRSINGAIGGGRRCRSGDFSGGTSSLIRRDHHLCRRRTTAARSGRGTDGSRRAGEARCEACVREDACTACRDGHRARGRWPVGRCGCRPVIGNQPRRHRALSLDGVRRQRRRAPSARAGQQRHRGGPVLQRRTPAAAGGPQRAAAFLAARTGWPGPTARSGAMVALASLLCCGLSKERRTAEQATGTRRVPGHVGRRRHAWAASMRRFAA